MLVNPDYLKPLFTDPIGRFMVVLAIAMMIIGVLLIKKLISFRV